MHDVRRGRYRLIGSDVRKIFEAGYPGCLRSSTSVFFATPLWD